MIRIPEAAWAVFTVGAVPGNPERMEIFAGRVAGEASVEHADCPELKWYCIGNLMIGII